IEQLARANAVVFDKTGTITSGKRTKVQYEGVELSKEEEALLKNTLRASNHPLSRSLYELLEEYEISPPEAFAEIPGKGMTASNASTLMKVGSAGFVGGGAGTATMDTSVHISANNEYRGRYIFRNEYREGVKEVFRDLKKDFELSILSGDNDGERERLEKL